MIDMNNEINEKLKTLPDKSGVYIMKNIHGDIIYVGKAKNLKNRVRSYFKSHKHTPKVASMLENVDSFEYIITDSELEALVLENNLIKENMPKYNILLKDDKTYPFIKVTVKELYPRILHTRRIVKDGSLYFGPYQSSAELKQLITLVREIFCLRFCNSEFYEGFTLKRPCLYYQLGKCKGVCNMQISPEEYRKLIDGAIEFINGNTREITQELQRQMKEAASLLDFEKAALCRDRLEAIENLGKRQKVVNPNGNNIDAIAMYNSNNVACVQLFFIRGGNVIGREHYFINDTDDVSNGEILSEFMLRYYEDATFIPSTILAQYEPDDVESLEEFITSKTSRSVKIKVPKIGENASLMRMIGANAHKEHSERELKVLRDIDFKNGALSELADIMQLESPPMYIEAYDISNMGDNTSVASMVVYKEGKPYTKRYRNFKINNKDTQDDYASMREVLERRFKRAAMESQLIEKGELKSENAHFLPLPDVIFVDGGEGHRNAVVPIVEESGIPVFGIVKDENHRTRALVGENGEIIIDKTSNAFMLITRIQDEMHRRAISYLRKNQSKKVYASELDEIDGVGEKRKKLLLSKFKSVKNIKNASVEELCQVQGIDRGTAMKIFSYFNDESK